MTRRIAYLQASAQLTKKLLDLSAQLHESGVERSLLDLVNIRASQQNGCAFCLDMHIKEARIHGERELRLHHVAIWRESTLFTERERAALAWTEALTELAEQGVPDELYERCRMHFSERELSDLTFAVGVINLWNRLNVAFRTTPGSSDEALGLDKANLT
jgi:AhpD family alkylhydroperoxidase